MGDSSFSVEKLRERVVSATEPEPLARLASAVKVAVELEQSADQLVDGFVAEARAAGCSWAQIGDTLGVTKQAAQQRFGFVSRIEPGPRPGRFVMRPRPEWLGVLTGELLAVAQDEALALGHNYLGTEHLLLALLEDRERVAAHALGALGVTADAVRAMVNETVGEGPPREAECLAMRPRLKRALELSQREAQRLGVCGAGSEHILLGLLCVEEGLAVKILEKLGASPKRVRATLAPMIGVGAGELEPRRGRRRARMARR